MQSPMRALLVLALLFFIVETRVRRCRRATGCPRPGYSRPSGAAQQSHPRVASRRGMSSDRYFEENGKHYLELHERVPSPNGGYEIVKKVVETTPPPYGRSASEDRQRQQGPIQYDDMWFEPAGQQSYPRLLFSPHQGWREMTEHDLRRIRQIRPLKEYDPELMYPIRGLPEQERERAQSGNEQQATESYDEEVNPVVIRRKDHLGQTWYLRDSKWHLESQGGSESIGDGERSPSRAQPSIGDGDRSQSRAQPSIGDEDRSQSRAQPEHRNGEWVYRDGAWHHEPEVQQKEVEHQKEEPEPEPEVLDSPGTGTAEGTRTGDWVFVDGAWFYEPLQQQITTETTPNNGEWIFRDGAWHFETAGSMESMQEPVQSPAEHADSGGIVEDAPMRDSVVKVRKFHLPEDHYQRLVEKAVQVNDNDNTSNDLGTDYSNWYYMYLDQGGSPDGAGASKASEGADQNEAGHLSEGRHGTAPYINSEDSRSVIFQEEEDPVPSKSRSSYFIREGSVGAMVYTEGDSDDWNALVHKESNSGHKPRLLSVDEFQRLQPSHTGLLPLHRGAAQQSCNGVPWYERNNIFWLLRTQPCDDDAPEGRILLPNGEVLRFYGHPQLVHN